MDAHRLAEERSVEYHRVVADRLHHRPGVLDDARRRVHDWLTAARENRSPAPEYAQRWSAVLAGEPSDIAAFLVERSDLADELRQSSPFAGSLEPRERWKIWRDTRDRLAPTPPT
jgi:hypothetical protein